MLRAVVCAIAFLVSGTASATPPNVILTAEFTEPTRRYDHGVLGDDVEWGAMHVTFDACAGCEHKTIMQRTIRLPETRVFEDLKPRIIHDEFGLTALMVVESDINLGARLSIYTESGLYHATPFIGQSHRWLAPVGSTDLDGDGIPEIAYVEKPHLSKELKIWKFEEAGLSFVTSLRGLTNHRIGEDFISGGIRDCGSGPEIITADANWRWVMATRLRAGKLEARRLIPFMGKSSFQDVLACRA